MTAAERETEQTDARLREAVKDYLAVREMVCAELDDAEPHDQRALLDRVIAARAFMAAIVAEPSA